METPLSAAYAGALAILLMTCCTSYTGSCLSHSRDNTLHAAIPLVLISIIDSLLNYVVIFAIQIDDLYKTIGIALKGMTFFIGCVCIYFVHASMCQHRTNADGYKNEAQAMSAFMKSRPCTIRLLALLSVIDIDVLQLTYSKVYGREWSNAPLEAWSILYIRSLTFIPLLLSVIPLGVIKAASFMDMAESNQSESLFLLFSTIISLLNLCAKLLFCVLPLLCSSTHSEPADDFDDIHGVEGDEYCNYDRKTLKRKKKKKKKNKAQQKTRANTLDVDDSSEGR